MGNTQHKSPPRRWNSLQPDMFMKNDYSSASLGNLFRTWTLRSTVSERNVSYDSETQRYNSTRDKWPLPLIESAFLPEFQMKGEVGESDFEVLQVIAKGAFGEVVKVVRKDKGKVYAMKILSKAEIFRENAVQQCKDEVTIQSMLGNHPFIVRAYHYWQNRRNLFIVTDYVPHGELFKVWQAEGRFCEDLVKIYLAELAMAVDYLHNNGVIYRDVKMENVLLDEMGHCRLIDFGLSKWLEKGCKTRTICGTIIFMAPEILSAQCYDHAADWWSLGILTYAMLTGTYPIYGVNNHLEMCSMVQSHAYNFSSDGEYSNQSKQLIKRLLCREPENRLQSLNSLKFTPFFKDFNFDKVLQKQVIFIVNTS